MAHVKRTCNNEKCGKEYLADTRNINRGWGLCCSKSCAAQVRERKKPGYDPERVKRNNIRRANWNKGAYEKGANLFARKRGFPTYADLEETDAMDDGSWEGGGHVEISVCETCNLRADYCRCGEDADW